MKTLSRKGLRWVSVLPHVRWYSTTWKLWILPRNTTLHVEHFSSFLLCFQFYFEPSVPPSSVAFVRFVQEFRAIPGSGKHPGVSCAERRWQKEMKTWPHLPSRVWLPWDPGVGVGPHRHQHWQCMDTPRDDGSKVKKVTGWPWRSGRASRRRRHLRWVLKNKC